MSKAQRGPAPRYEITKTYPQRGPLQQYRLAASTSFGCFRCGCEKTSKLVTVFRQDWNRLLCNGCYGRLLSLYDVRAGTPDAAAAADAIADELLKMVSVDDVRRAEDLLRVRESRAERLDPKSLRLLATAEYVATHLANGSDLDWSAAVIGLCKAVEIEVVQRVIEPLTAACKGLDLRDDIADKDIGRVAKYCAGRAAKPPEVGVVRHFLQTAAHSESRQDSSPLLQAFRDVTRRWPHSDWLLTPTGALSSLEVITTKFRNPAAHTEELGPPDYAECVDLVLGDAGVLWSVLRATTPR